MLLCVHSEAHNDMNVLDINVVDMSYVYCLTHLSGPCLWLGKMSETSVKI